MRLCLFILTIGLTLGCNHEEQVSSIDPLNWENRKAIVADSLRKGSTYLPVYSQIYSLTKIGTHNLTATVSLRNINPNDSVYVLKAEYFNTHGEHIRTYFNNPIYLAPLETVEIVIDERDNLGGTGANFIFDWAVKSKSHSPLFEAVMISTTGRQGLSFSTRGVEIE